MTDEKTAFIFVTLAVVVGVLFGVVSNWMWPT